MSWRVWWVPWRTSAACYWSCLHLSQFIACLTSSTRRSWQLRCRRRWLSSSVAETQQCLWQILIRAEAQQCLWPTLIRRLSDNWLSSVMMARVRCGAKLMILTASLSWIYRHIVYVIEIRWFSSASWWKNLQLQLRMYANERHAAVAFFYSEQCSVLILRVAK